MKLQPEIYELLHKRGLQTEQEIAEFLSDKPQKTYDPFLLLNMEAGVDLILSAIEDDERICIYGDYDADGITSTAVMTEVLSQLTENLTYYIPSRFEEGYGLNCGALDRIKAAGTDLVVTVDCGSVSCEEVEYAKAIGLKILVTDHHTMTDKGADCLIINPMQPGCPYPFKHLAGVGVAFKLAQAIAAETGLPKSVVNRTLDLVGVGTIGDIVPLVDENRTLAKYGIRALNVTARPGFTQLIEGVSLRRGGITSEQISYVLVPHLNASGRIRSARIGTALLMEKDGTKASERVQTLIDCNEERKRLQNETYEICRKKVEKEYLQDSFLVIELPDAHEGITGIVAGKIKDVYHRPAVIVTPAQEGCLKGTGRSIDGVNIYQLLKENERLFERFGGHAAACGFTMKAENLQKLRENLNRSMAALTARNPEILNQRITAELDLSGDQICLELAEQIQLLEPFGCENPRPLIRVEMRPVSVKKMGNKGQYTRFTGILDNGREVQCVIFRNASAYDELLQEAAVIRVTGELQSQNWNSRQYLQITVIYAEKIGETYD